MIGDILYHDLKGKLTVSKKKYRRLGNKSVEFAIDEKGKEHELDGTEIPYEEYEAKEAKKSTPRMSSEVGFIKGEPGADADEDYIIEAVIPRVLEQIRQPEDGKDGEDADIELIVREMLPLVMEQMPRPKELNEALVIERILSRVRLPQDGKQGEKGKDGSPDTPVQVKEKLESLRGDERLDASAIKNLPKPSIIGGGGSYTGLAKVDASGTPGTLQEKLVAGSGITITKTNDTLVFVGSADGVVQSIVAGNNIDVDATDPANPIVSVETLEKADVGLGNADNTSDVNKPVSTAQQAALDLKKDVVERELTVLDDMQTEDWNYTGSGTFSYDTTDFISGTKSAKLITAGGGTAAWEYLYKDIVFSKNPKKMTFFEVDVKVEDAEHITRFYLQIFSNTAGNDYRSANLESTGRKNVPDGDWITLKAAIHCFDPVSGETIESIGDSFQRVRLAFSDDGTPVTFRIGAIRMVEVPKKAYVLLTFDDSNKSTFTKAMPIMEKYGIKGTSFNIKENVALGDGGSAQYMTMAQVKVLERLGWSNGIHGQSPNDNGWGNLTEEQLVKYITDSINHWKANNITSALDTVAYPNGNFGDGYDHYIYRVAKKFFKLGRGTHTDVTEPFPEMTDPLLLHTGRRLYLGIVDTATVVSQLDALAEEGGLAVIPGHDVVDSGAVGGDILTSEFQTVVEKIAELAEQGSVIPITMAQLRDIVSSRSVEDAQPFNSYIGFPDATGAAADVQGANRAWFRECLVSVPIKISSLTFAVTAQAGNVCLGIYSEEGKLLATTGSVACPAVGVNTIALTTPLILQRGRYYLALACDTITTAAFRGTATFLMAGGYRKDSSFPLADLAGRVDAETESSSRAFSIVGR